MTNHYIAGRLDTLALSGSNDGLTPVLTTLQLKIEQFCHLTEYSAFVRQKIFSWYDYTELLMSWNLKTSMANYTGIYIWKPFLEFHSNTKSPWNHSMRTRPVWVQAQARVYRSDLSVRFLSVQRRRKQQWRLKSYQYLVARVQLKLPQIIQMVLLNLLSHLVKLSLIQVQKAKGE